MRCDGWRWKKVKMKIAIFRSIVIYRLHVVEAENVFFVLVFFSLHFTRSCVRTRQLVWSPEGKMRAMAIFQMSCVRDFPRRSTIHFIVWHRGVPFQWSMGSCSLPLGQNKINSLRWREANRLYYSTCVRACRARKLIECSRAIICVSRKHMPFKFVEYLIFTFCMVTSDVHVLCSKQICVDIYSSRCCSSIVYFDLV